LRVWGTHPTVGPLFAMVPTATSRRVHSRPLAASVTMHRLDLGMLGSMVVCCHPTPEYKGAALTSGRPRRAYKRQRLRSERSWGERPTSRLLAVLGAPAFGHAGYPAPDDRSTRPVWSRARETRNFARGVRHCGGTTRTRAAAHPRQVYFVRVS
jgi:hypothetical protein